MPENNMNGVYSTPIEDRHCGGNTGGLFGGCDSEVLFFIIIFLLLFTSFGYGR